MSIVADDKPEDFDGLLLGDKERAERLEGMVDRMSETIVNLNMELAAWKELYNEVASQLNYNNHLLLQIQDVLNKKITGSKVCNHYFVDGACAHCGVTVAQFTTRA